jgi:hypothetical protein
LADARALIALTMLSAGVAGVAKCMLREEVRWNNFTFFEGGMKVERRKGKITNSTDSYQFLWEDW